jgi:hypothetical protein
MRAPCRLQAPVGFVAQLTNWSSLCFEAQTKKPLRWFWGPNHQTAAVDFEAQTGKPSTTGFEAKPREIVNLSFKAKPRNLHHRFWDQTEKNHHHRFWGQTGRNRPSGFEDKPLTNRPSHFEAKPLKNRQPWFWGSTKKLTLLVSSCMVQTAHNVTWTLDRSTTEYPTCVIIPSPLHQVSYSCHDPRHCLSCRTCNLHTTRQANMTLHMIQRIKVKQLKCLGFKFKPQHVNTTRNPLIRDGFLVTFIGNVTT